jgi:type IV fimbrial biogenesis protein FimT
MYCSVPSPQRGLSLVELVMTLTVVAIALSASLPLFTDLRAGIQMRTNLNHWMSVLAQARISAVERGRPVVACPASGERCEATLFWHHGWILFEDTDHDGQRGSDEPLLLSSPPSTEVRIGSSSGRQRIRYRPDGSSEGSNVTLTFCDRRGADKARTIVLSNAGRARSGSATPEQAALVCGSG